MVRQRSDDPEIEPLPREKRAARLRRYALALVLAMVLAALIIAFVVFVGTALAPLLER